MLTADGEQGAEVYAAAVTRDQAQIAFADAVRMVRSSPALRERVHESGLRQVYNLAHLESGSFFRPISSEGRSLDGKRPHCVLDRDFDDEFFAYVCGLDDSDDPFKDESCWIKANPNLGVSVTLKYLRKQVREARGMPAKASIVRRLNFCQWVEASNPWIDFGAWNACEVDTADFPSMQDRDVYAAVDLSGTRDLTALAIVAPDGEDFDASVEFWTPKETLHERAKRDRTPYDAWVDTGHIVATPGRSVDYGFVA